MEFTFYIFSSCKAGKKENLVDVFVFLSVLKKAPVKLSRQKLSGHSMHWFLGKKTVLTGWEDVRNVIHKI